MERVASVPPWGVPHLCDTIKLPEGPKAPKYRGKRENGFAAVERNGFMDGKNLWRFKHYRLLAVYFVMPCIGDDVISSNIFLGKI